MSDPNYVVTILRRLLPSVCDSSFSYDPDGWSENNPTWGHCAIIALTVQLYCGGKIYETSLKGTRFAHMLRHYWNVLDDGTVVDLTANQFRGRWKVPYDQGTPVDATFILRFESTRRRYISFLRQLLSRL